MSETWNNERIWQWYNSRPWIRGCNFQGSDCANFIDQWQEYGFEERLTTADRELKLAAETGFNSIRIIMDFFVWKNGRSGYMNRLEQYIQTAAKHGISCMITLANDCMPVKEEALARLKLGEQECHLGWHGGRKISQHGTFNEAGYHLLDEPELAEEYYAFVEEIVETYKADERVLIWDVFNEPGNSNRGNLSLPHLKKFFQIIRKINPIQPLTVGIWTHEGKVDELPEIEKFGLDNSDIISFHNYGSYETNVCILKRLKKLGKPIINTEWLARGLHNTVQEMYPLFYLEGVGCYNWGFVAGKSQRFEAWNMIWDSYEKDPNLDFDFTKWFHDLYRPSLRPYDPKEIELIKRFSKMADEDFAKKQK